MRCSVPNCTSDTKRTTKSHGITFHLFPKEAGLRSAWIEALGIADWEPRDRSTVCSEHFRNDDFYQTKCGLRKIKSGAVPFVMQDSSQDLDAPAALKVCRICLAMDTKLYPITDRKFDFLYQQLTGLTIDVEDKLPQKLCWECAHRLAASHRFRSRALLSHQLMMAAWGSEGFITVRDVRSINRAANGLQSALVHKVYEANDCDLVTSESEPTLKVEREASDDVADDPCQELDDAADVPEDEEACDVTLGMPEAVKLEPDLAPMMGAEVKDEEHAIYFNEYDQFDSDDNRKLSEVFAKPKGRAKRKRPKVEKAEKLEKAEKMEKRARAARAPKRKDSDDNPSTTMDKYKVSDVKRRKTSDGLDETLFTISSLTYDEQIEEIAKRQETAAYRNAPYKCTICYRGFQIRDRHEAHAVRHSEQSGAYECFICKTRLKTARALRKHLTAQHTEKFSCKGCPFVTRNRGVAREHEKWHAGTKYQCPHCACEFDKLTTYMGHIRIKHASDFVCELCGYTFVSKKGIDVHKKKKHRLHDKNISLEGPYCDVCEVRFISEEAHSRHLKLSSRHSSEGDPNRIRNDSQSMGSERGGRVVRRIERRPVVHPRTQDRDRPPDPGPVACEQCGLQLRDLRLYAQHFRRAHPDKNRTKYPAMKTPCMCEQCGRIFQSMALLKDHMWVHTGEKRFKCSSCDKSFTQKSNLVFHLRVHSAQRPSYECPLCGKHFAFFNNRRRHMFIHTGLKPFRCETCGKCFTTAGEQRAHVQHVHLKKPWPKRARARRDWHKAQP